MLLLTGGTDGGDRDAVVAGARDIAASGWRGPVVVAGNADARPDVEDLLAGVPHVVADNVVPRIGALAPESARRAIREMFLDHVIGGKQLSSRATATGQTFASMVLGATPDVVLTGVELLAAELGATAPGSGVVVVDIGGATTDVHSVVVLDPEEAGLSREVVATTPVTRTVEGDLGMRWSAATTAQAAAAAGLDLPVDAVRRAADPAYLPGDADGRAGDEALASAAALLAMRRHAAAPGWCSHPRAGWSSARGRTCVRWTCWSGRAVSCGPAVTTRSGASSAPVTGPDPDGWQLPEDPRVVVDTDYVLAAAGPDRTQRRRRDALEQARRLVCNSLSAWR